MLVCPFCGALETDRFEIEGQRFLVFGCMFSPSFDRALSDEEVAVRLAQDYGTKGSAYFRGMCDRLHLVVTKPPAEAPSTAGPD